jgi:hypothetical protein
MKPVLAAAFITLQAFSVGPTTAQSVQPPAIAALRCSDIANADPAYQAALVYYAAGYRDGLDYAMALNTSVSTQTSSALSAMASTPSSAVPAAPSFPGAVAAEGNVASEPPSAASSSAPASRTAFPAVLGGLVLQAQPVIDACKQSPNALLTDIIANRGGGTGFKGNHGGAPGAAPAGTSTTLPATGGTTGAGSTAPAGAASVGGPPAVSSDLQGASQQLQHSLSSGTPPPASAAAPATGASSP